MAGPPKVNKVDDVREHSVHSHRSQHGKSSVIIVCPFCGQETVAYLWSLAGSGKICECKEVIHYTRVSKRRANNGTTTQSK
jgi:hypothetical protein